MKKLLVLIAAFLLLTPLASASEKYDAIVNDSLPNVQELLISGQNLDVDTTEETIWEAGGAYIYYTTASVVEVLSDDADDLDADTGAQEVTVYGLDANYNEVNEAVTMNGATPVATTQTFLRILKAVVTAAGSSGTNEGTITVRDDSDTPTLCTIPPGAGRSSMAMWTVPAGRTAFITSLTVSNMDDAVGASVRLYIREYGGYLLSTYVTQIVSGGLYIPFELPIRVSQKSDIEIRATGIAADAAVAVSFNLYYK